DPYTSRPLRPLKTPPKERKPISKPLTRQSEKNKNGKIIVSHAKSKAAPASKAQSNATQPADTKPAAPAFNPYPRGPEPSAPRTPPGYHPHVPVLAPGRLDWTFV